MPIINRHVQNFQQMPDSQNRRELKLFVLYIFYNYFLKIFFHFTYPIIYASFPDNANEDIFWAGIEDSVLDKILSSLFLNLFYDFVWLLPYTILNLIIYINLINSLIQNKKDIIKKQSIFILKSYAFWCILYLCIVGYIFYTKGSFEDSHSPYAPYGSLSTIYLFLGNIIFTLIFIPSWNHSLKKWIN